MLPAGPRAVAPALPCTASSSACLQPREAAARLAQRWQEGVAHFGQRHVENEREGLPAGIVYADSRAMLEDRIAALREANIYERQRYRHLLGMPMLLKSEGDSAEARTPFMVARIMATGQTELFATGSYHDRFVRQGGQLRLQSRVAVCDSTVTDTLLALPL